MAGSNVNDQSGEHCCGVTPLHDATENGHVHVVKLLLSHGASINLKDDKVSFGEMHRIIVHHKSGSPMILSLILPFSCHTFPFKLVIRICHWIKIKTFTE